MTACSYPITDSLIEWRLREKYTLGMRKTTIVYCVCLHLLVLAMLAKSDFIDRIDRRLGVNWPWFTNELSRTFHTEFSRHKRAMGTIQHGSVIFIGDSITHGLPVGVVCDNAVNYGIPADTTAGVLTRIYAYMPVIRLAKSVVIAIGTNDAKVRTSDQAFKNYCKILDAIPEDIHVFASGVLPTDFGRGEHQLSKQKWRHEFNANVSSEASRRRNVTFIDSSAVLDVNSDGKLDGQFHTGDGLHLNSLGYMTWAKHLRSLINVNE